MVNKMSGRVKKSQLSKEDLEEQKIEELRKKDMAKYIGNNIHQYRIKMKLTREQLAEKSHITASHLYQLEIGNSVPSIITIIDICNALNITVAQLTDNLLYNDVNKYIELISKDFNKLSEHNKKAVINLIENLIEE